MLILAIDVYRCHVLMGQLIALKKKDQEEAVQPALNRLSSNGYYFAEDKLPSILSFVFYADRQFCLE